MDGIFVAFHNTVQLFGFQYIPTTEMDIGLFGKNGVGDGIFRMCVGLLSKILQTVKECSPNQVCD